jgi:hypothetical protein
MGEEPGAPDSASGQGGGWLQIVVQVAGVLAGLATVVYLAGGVVLSLRLAFVGLPWANVVSQLPREFLISIGAGEVLFPALLVGALYVLSRLLRTGLEKPPTPPRWRDGANTRRWAIEGYLRAWGLLAIPLAIVLLSRVFHFDFGWVTSKAAVVIAVGLLVLAVVAIAVQETRAAVIEAVDASLHWDGARMVGVMAGIYVVAAIPAMMAGAASVSLSVAKVCDVDNFAEHGFLVGETSDRVYLGEETTDRPRRIAVIPFAKVEELFIGHDADEATCEVVNAPPRSMLRPYRSHGHNPLDEASGGDSLRWPGDPAPRAH